MKKTPVVFVVDRESGLAQPEVKAGQEWVLQGEGVATVKFDGQACLWRDGKLWKRYDRKLNKQAQRKKDRGDALGELSEDHFKVPPAGFEPCEASFDPVSHHWPGWVPVSAEDPADKWLRQAMEDTDPSSLVENATYELVGPSLSDNPYKLDRHALWRHGSEVLDVPDRSFDAIRALLDAHYIEGLVFHHPDGRVAKIRRKDFKMFWVKDDVRDTWKRRPGMN